MENYYRFFIITSVSITILFLVYLIISRKETNFKLLITYLVSSLIFALLLPINNFKLDIGLAGILQNPTQIDQNIENENSIDKKIALNPVENNPGANLKSKKKELGNNVNINTIALAIYLIIGMLLIFRTVFSICKITWYYLISEKKKQHGFTIIYINKSCIPFAFFNLIFISKTIKNENIQQIIEHEKIHAKQFHTIDLLLTELLVAAMWFNPFIWMYKRALQQVHEFLADEGVLNSGIDQLEYQSILVNQAAEGSLVAVSSNFSYSLIKKRIMMMSKTKTHGHLGYKLLFLVPLLFVLIFAVSCANGQENTSNKLVAVVAPTKMNVLYYGVNNPVSIGVTGANMKDIEATIDKGTISGENGNYIVRVKKLGKATITVKANNKTVTKKIFRVKTISDPVATVNNHWNKNELTKKELLEAKGISVLFVNFDFDLMFKVVGFNITASYNGKTVDAKRVNEGSFSNAQIDIIKNAPPGTKIYIEEIKAKGPDGVIRNLRPISIKIIE